MLNSRYFKPNFPALKAELEKTRLGNVAKYITFQAVGALCYVQINSLLTYNFFPINSFALYTNKTSATPTNRGFRENWTCVILIEEMDVAPNYNFPSQGHPSNIQWKIHYKEFTNDSVWSVGKESNKNWIDNWLIPLSEEEILAFTYGLSF